MGNLASSFNFQPSELKRLTLNELYMWQEQAERIAKAFKPKK